MILKRLTNSKLVGFYCCIIFSLIIYSCNKTNKQEEMIIHNQNGLSGHLEQIIECFVEEYNIQGKSFYISESYPISENEFPILKIDINKYVYISITPYNEIPKIAENRVLYTTELNDYVLFYVMDKDKIMAISNNLIWKKIESPKNEENEIPKVLGVIDYKETEFLYNKEENVIELSDFKSESCKGRLNDEYEW